MASPPARMLPPGSVRVTWATAWGSGSNGMPSMGMSPYLTMFSSPPNTSCQWVKASAVVPGKAMYVATVAVMISP